MYVRYLRRASLDLQEIGTYVDRDSPVAARRVLATIERHIALLCDFPDLGRWSGVQSVRIAPVPRLPYLIFYRRVGDELRILRVRHSRRRAIAAT